MKAVDVLGGIDALRHDVGIDVLRQRQLHQDAVDEGIGVEVADQLDELVLRHRFRQIVGIGFHPDGLGRPALVAHVDLRCWILAHQNDRETRRRLVRRQRAPRSAP